MVESGEIVFFFRISIKSYILPFYSKAVHFKKKNTLQRTEFLHTNFFSANDLKQSYIEYWVSARRLDLENFQNLAENATIDEASPMVGDSWMLNAVWCILKVPQIGCVCSGECLHWCASLWDLGDGVAPNRIFQTNSIAVCKCCILVFYIILTFTLVHVVDNFRRWYPSQRDFSN